ncbi:MAG: hypothetical protein K2O89_07275 [Clostridia bacterium]|nr:hypothetical protein [Clostridia bacterium]
MNSSKLNEQIYAYLGFHSVERSEEVDAEISKCLDELKELAHFRYTYKFFSALPDFLLCEPYTEYLRGSSGVIVAVMTLGCEVDARIKFYGRTDAAKSLVLDAAASAYLEYLSDEYEKTLGENLSYRFCPGYGGSSVEDLKHIFEILSPEKIGVTLSETNYMLPSKSMAGIIAVGGKAKKSCKNCIVYEHCNLRKGGAKCYGSEKL